MKIKFKQSAYIIPLGRVVSVDEEVEMEDSKAKGFIEADFASEVVNEKKVAEKSEEANDEVKAVKEKEKPKKVARKDKENKVGE